MIFNKSHPRDPLSNDKERLSPVLLFGAQSKSQNIKEFSQSNTPKVDHWDSILKIDPDHRLLAQNGLALNQTLHNVSAAFDHLRSRIFKAMDKNGWKRLAITSPGPECGASFVAANLALGLARLPNCRSVLFDLNLRKPRQAALWGQSQIEPIANLVFGKTLPEQHLRAVNDTLALALNTQIHQNPASLLHHSEFSNMLQRVQTEFVPQMMIFDMAPVLSCDDLMIISGQIDAVLMVADGTHTSPEDIAQSQKLIGEHLPILGVVLNRAQDRPLHNLLAKWS